MVTLSALETNRRAGTTRVDGQKASREGSISHNALEVVRIVTEDVTDETES